jgi:(2Fe-2S) ferredoxin
MAVVDLLETEKCLFICNGGSCMKKDAEIVTVEIRKKIAELGFKDTIHTVRTRCIGRCDDAPVVFSSPDSVWYKEVYPEDVGGFIEKYVAANSLSPEYFLYKMGEKQINSDSIPTKIRKKNIENGK